LLVAVISWCAIVCLSFVPFQQETRVLEDLSQGPTRIDPTPRNPRAAELLRYPLGIAACVVLLVGFVAMPQADPSSRWPFIFVY
ncbi:ABC transporter permease, partial [Pseudomonas sp. MPR-R2A5]